MKIIKVFALLILGFIVSSNALAFEFSNNECEFKVKFPFPPTVKKVVQSLGDGAYSNTYMAQAIDDRSYIVYSAQCDTSLKLISGITNNQKRKMAEWSISEWSKMVNLESSRMYWEEQGNYVTLRMIGRKILIEDGKSIKMSFQSRTYLGEVSTMTVIVGEPPDFSPSANMYDFLNNSVSMGR